MKKKTNYYNRSMENKENMKKNEEKREVSKTDKN